MSNGEERWVCQRHPVVERVLALVEPLLRAEGYDLVDLDYQSVGRPALRLFVDRLAEEISPGTPSPINFADLSALTRLVSDSLDVADPISGAYNLEISSPGIDRALTRRGDFEAAVGHQVKIETRDMIEGRRRFGGTIAEVTAEGVVVEVDGRLWELPAKLIGKARLKSEPAPRAGRVGRRGAG